jgi:uncharacterized protein YndB with AHSA1/START domain
MTYETTIDVDTRLPLVRIRREFDAPVQRVFRAHVDPSLFVRWIGPNDTDAKVEHWDARTGGSWRYASIRGDFRATFWGSFHELRDDELVIQTQTYEGTPDRVSLDRLTLESISLNRTLLVCTSLHESFEDRDALIASGMERGVRQGYEQLDRLLLTSPEARDSR